VENYFYNVKQKNKKLANISRVHMSPFLMKPFQIPEVFPLDKHFFSFHRKWLIASYAFIGFRVPFVKTEAGLLDDLFVFDQLKERGQEKISQQTYVICPESSTFSTNAADVSSVCK
jgi:hypothetical protein